MQRLIKGFAVGILCLQWSLPASAQVVNATCSVIGNPSSLVINTSSTDLNADGAFNLTCSCPDGLVVSANGASIGLSIVPGQSTTRNGLAGIKLLNDSTFTDRISGIPYGEIITYAVKVSAPSGQTLQFGSYSVAVKFELSALPQCLAPPPPPGGD